jgi:hypothetical protein
MGIRQFSRWRHPAHQAVEAAGEEEHQHLAPQQRLASQRHLAPQQHLAPRDLAGQPAEERSPEAAR